MVLGVHLCMLISLLSNASNAVDYRSAWIASFLDLGEHKKIGYSGKFVVNF